MCEAGLVERASEASRFSFDFIDTVKWKHFVLRTYRFLNERSSPRYFDGALIVRRRHLHSASERSASEAFIQQYAGLVSFDLRISGDVLFVMVAAEVVCTRTSFSFSIIYFARERERERCEHV